VKWHRAEAVELHLKCSYSIGSQTQEDWTCDLLVVLCRDGMGPWLVVDDKCRFGDPR
jgi:hypothetical protein